jgi:glutamate/tyrosine decarboxylase-like PLP-dependent enzyme
VPFDEIHERVERDVFPYSVTLAHPRFYAFIPSPGNFVSAMADALAAGYNPFVGTWLGGSGPSALEIVTVDWLRELCGLPPAGGGLLTSGGSAANFTALAAARNALAPSGPDGCTVYYGDQAHYSNERALRLLGFSREQMRVIPSTRRYAMDVGALADAVASDRAKGLRPVAVVGTAGTTSVGAVDDLDAIASVCARNEAWFHVDGAYGAAAAISPRLRGLLRGIERADSVSLDPHKWLFQPFEIGCALVRDMKALRDAFQIMPDYLKDVHGLGEMNFADYGMQLTRSFRALKLWMSLQYFGLARFRRAVERGVELAVFAQRLVAARPGWEVLTPAQMAIFSFRRVPEGWEPDRVDRLNDMLVAVVMRDGFAALSSTILDGRTALRMCTINPSTRERDIEETFEKLDAAAATFVEGREAL